MNAPETPTAPADEESSQRRLAASYKLDAEADGPGAWTLAGVGRGLIIAVVSLAMGLMVGNILVPRPRQRGAEQSNAPLQAVPLSKEDLAFVSPLARSSKVLSYEVEAIQKGEQSIKLQLVQGQETVTLYIKKANELQAPGRFGSYMIFYENSGAGPRDGALLATELASQLAAHASDPAPPALR